ncbi:MAG: TauD/TfdA dioxygenase family protein [Gammaproteobacteria bacterium]
MELTPITGTFGATITGVDIHRADSNVVGAIRDALARHKVLVVPGQTELTPPALLEFAEQFGRAEKEHHPTHPDVPGAVGVKVIDGTDYQTGVNVNPIWHTDGATRTNTAWLSFLHGHQVPPYGRDTLFADMEAAFDRLSPTLQGFLEGLQATHSWGVQKPDAPPVTHPLILSNPHTGRKALYVNQFYTRGIAGLHRAESDVLLKYLLDQALVPELQLRVSWQPGTLTIWDNERTQHYLVRDRSFARIMHRVMVTTAH